MSNHPAGARPGLAPRNALSYGEKKTMPTPSDSRNQGMIGLMKLMHEYTTTRATTTLMASLRTARGYQRKKTQGARRPPVEESNERD